MNNPTALPAKLTAQWAYQLGQWNGRFDCPFGQYEAQFPEPESVLQTSLHELMGGACWLFSVDYSIGLKACIAMSSLPTGRTVEKEMALQHRIALETQRQLDKDLKIELLPTGQFGPVLVAFVPNEVANPGNGALFPLAGAVFSTESNAIVSLSKHMLFARDKSRFEVAVVQTLPENVKPSEETSHILARNVSHVANSIIASMARQ